MIKVLVQPVQDFTIEELITLHFVRYNAVLVVHSKKRQFESLTSNEFNVRESKQVRRGA